MVLQQCEYILTVTEITLPKCKFYYNKTYTAFLYTDTNQSETTILMRRD